MWWYKYNYFKFNHPSLRGGGLVCTLEVRDMGKSKFVQLRLDQLELIIARWSVWEARRSFWWKWYGLDQLARVLLGNRRVEWRICIRSCFLQVIFEGENSFREESCNNPIFRYFIFNYFMCVYICLYVIIYP